MVIDYYRKNKPENIFGPTMAANLQSPEEIVIEQEQSTWIVNALQKMKPDFQQIIILRLINDLSHKEIASIIGISEGHSRILLFRALKKLKELL